MSINTSAPILFENSPFSVVADESSARCWSGRPKVLEALQRLTQTLLRRHDSSLDVMWANLGAGKTHTLFHLAYLLQSGSPGGDVVCAFVEMPEQIRHFHDLYKRIVAAIKTEDLARVLSTCPSNKLPESLVRAGNVLTNGSSTERALVRSWLNGERPYLNDLRRCSGIAERIEDDIAALDALCGIVKAFAASKTRLLVMIDEFQRVGVMGSSSRNRILSSVRTVFSRSPQLFSMVLAIQSMVEESAFDLIPPELKTLIGRKPGITLPEMSIEEADEFLIGRFAFFRPAGYIGSVSAPFERSALRETLVFLQQKLRVPLSPREILQAFAFIYDSADLQTEITARESVRILDEGYGSSEKHD